MKDLNYLKRMETLFDGVQHILCHINIRWSICVSSIFFYLVGFIDHNLLRLSKLGTQLSKESNHHKKGSTFQASQTQVNKAYQIQL